MRTLIFSMLLVAAVGAQASMSEKRPCQNRQGKQSGPDLMPKESYSSALPDSFRKSTPHVPSVGARGADGRRG